MIILTASLRIEYKRQNNKAMRDVQFILIKRKFKDFEDNEIDKF